MAEPEILFDVDASKILAKLHLGALEACKQWRADGFFVNTGIKNDNPSATPDNPGKVEFDITNGQYEVGYVTDVNFTFNNAFNRIAEQIAPLIAQLNVSGGESLGEDDADKPLLSKDINANKEKQRQNRNDAVNANIEKIDKQLQDLIKKNRNDLQKAGFEFTNALEEFKKSNAFNKWIVEQNKKRVEAKLNKIDPKTITQSTLKNYPELYNRFLNTVQKMLVKDSKTFMAQARKNGNGLDFDMISEKDKKSAFEGIKSYMQVFVGDKAKDFKEEQVVMQYVNPTAKTSTDKSLVENFEIVDAGSKAVEIQQKNNDADGKSAKLKVCFKIGYSVVVDK